MVPESSGTEHGGNLVSKSSKVGCGHSDVSLIKEDLRM